MPDRLRSRFAEGTKILHYREYGDAGFDPVDSVDRAHAAGRTPARTSSCIDTEAMKWDAVPNAGPMPGLFIKYLHVDPVTGFYTRLVHAQEGWSDHRLAHHPCYEEAYTTQGHMEYNFGTLDLGTYFFRPARVKHGHFTTMEGGATWLLRSDGELVNWYTQNEWVRWGGEAVNYGGPDEAPHPAALVAVDARPGRSRGAPTRTWRSCTRVRGSSRSTRASTTPRSTPPRPGRRPGRDRDRQGARRGQPAGRARRARPRPRPPARP